MRPSERLFKYLKIIFKREWELRISSLNDMKKALRLDVQKLDKQIDVMMEKIADVESTTAITAYERRILRLEKDKLLKVEKLENGCAPQCPFDEMFELAIAFLANPWKLWASNRLEDKRTVLKLAFDERLAYCRNEGLRTPKTTIPFNILGDKNMGKCKMAVLADMCEPVSDFISLFYGNLQGKLAIIASFTNLSLEICIFYSALSTNSLLNFTGL